MIALPAPWRFRGARRPAEPGFRVRGFVHDEVNVWCAEAEVPGTIRWVAAYGPSEEEAIAKLAAYLGSQP